MFGDSKMAFQVKVQPLNYVVYVLQGGECVT